MRRSSTGGRISAKPSYFDRIARGESVGCAHRRAIEHAGLEAPPARRRSVSNLATLPAPQRQLWSELGAVPGEFARLFDPAILAAQLPFLNGATITQQAPNTLSAIVERGGPVQVSFFGLPDIARLRPPHIASGNGLRIASLLDLAGTKAAVVQQRAEARDYYDIDALLADGRIDLPSALAGARAIYGPKFNPQITLKALSFFGDGNLSRLPRAVQDRLARAAREVDLDRLPDVTLG